jgi:hypothetical protein
MAAVIPCSHPPISEIAKLLICRKCHAAKVEGVLNLSSGIASYYLDATPLEMLVDPALVGKRVRVTIEALPDGGPEEVVNGTS